MLVETEKKGSTVCSEKISPDPKEASADELWRLKREAQARDRELAARGKFAQGQNLLIRPEVAQAAEVIWPKQRR